MPPLEIAAATVRLGLPPKDALLVAAGLGLDGIQLDARHELKPTELSETGRRAFLHKLGEAGLSVASIAFPTRRAFSDPDALDARIAATKAAMQFAFSLNARVLTFGLGAIPADDEDGRRQLLIDVLADLARFGDHVGVTPSIRPGREGSERLQQLLEAVDTGMLGVDFDPAAFLLAGESPAAAQRRMDGRITHVRVRDALRDRDGAGVETSLGRGEVPWDEMLALLDEAGFRGWYTLDRNQAADVAGDYRRGAKFLRNVAFG